MAGMSTMNATSSSSYNSRTVEIKVTGVARQDLMHTSNYTVKVPYRDLSRTIQNISRMGGKVAGVTLMPSSSDEAASAPSSTSAPNAKAASAPARKPASSSKEEGKKKD